MWKVKSEKLWHSLFFECKVKNFAFTLFREVNSEIKMTWDRVREVSGDWLPKFSFQIRRKQQPQNLDQISGIPLKILTKIQLPNLDQTWASNYWPNFSFRFSTKPFPGGFWTKWIFLAKRSTSTDSMSSIFCSISCGPSLPFDSLQVLDDIEYHGKGKKNEKYICGGLCHKIFKRYSRGGKFCDTFDDNEGVQTTFRGLMNVSTQFLSVCCWVLRFCGDIRLRSNLCGCHFLSRG